MEHVPGRDRGAEAARSIGGSRRGAKLCFGSRQGEGLADSIDFPVRTT